MLDGSKWVVQMSIDVPDYCQELENAARWPADLSASEAFGYWREWGVGEPLVLLHGGAGSWLHWAPVIGTLTKRFRVLAPDMPGFGRRRGLTHANPETIAQSLKQDLSRIFSERTQYSLAAFSFGALVGTRLARDCAQQVKSLHLVGPAGLSGPRRPYPRFVPLRGPTTADLRAATKQNLLKFMLYQQAAADPDAVSIQLWNTQPRPAATKSWSRSSDLEAILTKLTCPVQFIWGDQDETVADFLDTRRRLVVDLSPQAQVLIVTGAGHWIMQEFAYLTEATGDFSKLLVR